MHYAHNLWGGLNVFWATIGLLGLFALLNVIGISESASRGPGDLPVPHGDPDGSVGSPASAACCRRPLAARRELGRAEPKQGFIHALFFGFAAAMLGISGFESSANFIEEQKEGVFPKTLRNMWIAVAIFNPLISLLSLGLLPLAEIEQVPPDLLAQMGTRSAAGRRCAWWSASTRSWCCPAPC